MKFRRVVTFTRKLRFESSVISYGSQTKFSFSTATDRFESSVISYGSQTNVSAPGGPMLFESSVISYGSQTAFRFYEKTS